MPERAPEMPERAPGKRGGRGPRSRRRSSEHRQGEHRQAERKPGDGGQPGGGPRGLPEVPPSDSLLADEPAALELLAGGELEVEGRLVVASNATLYCTVRAPGKVAACVYKPVMGERPLWDFPPGTLAAREVAAYAVSRAGGWNIVPPTVMREGPFGRGMCQLWVDADDGTDLVQLARSRSNARLRDMAVFDAVVNNADRKIGHLLPVGDGRLYGCDHGVCFGEEYKLRTVLWQWRGQRLPDRAVTALTRLRGDLAGGQLEGELAGLLSTDELRATRDRVDLLIEHRVHPYPPENWPAVPWPPV
jgi:uncharacterized repeat protein (TIGR03843 family)